MKTFFGIFKGAEMIIGLLLGIGLLFHSSPIEAQSGEGFTRICVDSNGNPATGSPGVACGGASITPDGRYITFQSQATNLVADDTNGKMDVFVRDRQTSTTMRVSVSSTGGQASPAGSIYPRIIKRT